jgi:DNA-binding response OmpR family regulator
MEFLMRRILVIEDEPRIAAFIEKGLRSEGFTPTVAADGITGFDYAMSGEFDLAVLDIGLPGMDGFTLLDQLRSSGSTMPVIVLTARDSGTDTVRGLEGGADDYVAKPFRFAELMARIRLRLRNRTNSPIDQAMVLEHGAVLLDLRTRQASVEGASPTCRRASSPGRDVPAPSRPGAQPRAAAVTVWGYEYDPGSNVVDVYVGYLRKKLGARLITTVRGMGYRLG